MIAGSPSRDVLLLIAGYLAFMTATLDWHGYWSDEFHTIEAARLPWRELIRQRAAVGHPPLFFLLEKGWIAAFGHTEMATRSLPMLCGLGTLLLTYLVVRREAGSWPAWLACGLLLGSATQLLICHMARSYALLQLFTTALLAVLRAPAPPRRRDTALATLLSAGAFYTHGAALVGVFALLLAAAIVLPARWKLVVAGAAGSLLYVPFLIAFPRLDDVERHLGWVSPPSSGSLLQFPALLQFGRQLPDVPLALAVVTALLVVLLAVWSLRSSDGGALLALAWMLAWAAGAAAGALGLGLLTVERYFAPAAMWQSGFLAAVCGADNGHRPRRGKWLAGLLLSLSATGAALYFALPPFTPWREMAEYLHRHRKADEVVLIAAPPVLASPFAYYYRGEAQYNGDLPAEWDDRVAGLWLVLRDRDSASDFSSELERLWFRRANAMRWRRGTLQHWRRINPSERDSLPAPP